MRQPDRGALLTDEAPRGHLPTTRYFDGRASVYAAARPTYPAAAARAILEGMPTPASVLDVGCGTGLASHALALCGAEVIGLDPSRDMLRAARATAPSVGFVAGTGEALPFSTASRDIVVCAQAFHWLDADRALAEIHRVLRPGGRLALAWNVRMGESPFDRAYDDVVRRAETESRRRGRTVAPERVADPSRPGLFGASRKLSFPNPQVLDRARLLDRMRSASYFPADGAVRAELEALLAKAFGEFAIEGRVTIMQETQVTIVDRV